ncbi:MAG: NTP transferase domain-containing protein [Deltaproteobacteria bacterium]|nr:NTP transferase domain-containing protein [Deltaproteobacteria bacterium]
MKITKGIIPAAGLGTRMRPVTGGRPKELWPLGGKPMIQWAVEMHALSGITDIAIIISPSKEEIVHFLTYLKSHPPELLWDQVELTFFYQEQPRGVADAVSLVRDHIGAEPFALTMPDLVSFGAEPFLAQLMPHFFNYDTDVIGMTILTGARATGFGNVGRLQVEPLSPPVYRVTHLSDKQPGVITIDGSGPIFKGFGGGIYHPGYLDLIEKFRNVTPGELDDVPIHQHLIKTVGLNGVMVNGEVFDVGNVNGYQSAVNYLESKAQSQI